jgi:hypothetical protein
MSSNRSRSSRCSTRQWPYSVTLLTGIITSCYLLCPLSTILFVIILKNQEDFCSLKFFQQISLSLYHNAKSSIILFQQFVVYWQNSQAKYFHQH